MLIVTKINISPFSVCLNVYLFNMHKIIHNLIQLSRPVFHKYEKINIIIASK